MEPTIVEQFWSKGKLLMKAFIIILIVLFLQIPAHYVQTLINEREQRQTEAIAEVSSKWAGRQIISGPVLVLPYWRADADTLAKKTRSKHYAYFLPDVLDINAQVKNTEKHRGIYKVILYTSAISMKGSFSAPDIKRLNILPGDVIWQEATLKLPVSDNKGLNDEIQFKVNNTTLPMTPQTSEDAAIRHALYANINSDTMSNAANGFSFSTAYTINGSQDILFNPLGKTTSVQLTSDWPHPSFIGDALPQSSDIKTDGFTASWKSASHKRNFPQQWINGAYTISNFSADVHNKPYDRINPTTAAATNGTEISTSSFGSSLFVPVNGYQKTMRSVKYATLVILLTFAAFFLIETRNYKSVHPLHYGLVGIALILFYTLLLSFSEYINFNISYAIASVATIGLIGWFGKGLFESSRIATILSVLMVLLYTYVFTILQLQDYSLLLGSIGMFITLAVIMYYSRKFQW